MKKIFLITFLCFCMTVPLYGLGPGDLTYMTEEYVPYNFEKNGELKGISIDLLKLMWKEMECPEQTIKVYPWARGYTLV